MAEQAAPPARLYKYRSMRPPAQAFTESIFRPNCVWYAGASTFNDPFDCDHFIAIDRNSDEWRDILQRFEARFCQRGRTGPRHAGTPSRERPCDTRQREVADRPFSEEAALAAQVQPRSDRASARRPGASQSA
jgi:hypothetical protein